MFKKKISQNEFADILLEIRYEIEQLCIKAFNENFDYKNEKNKLIYEARIFSLWIVTITLPPSSNQLKDILHDKLCDYLKLEDKIKEFFFLEIDKRYKNYFAAFKMWQNNPQSGHMIGTVIVETIKNQNPDFSLDEIIPVVDGDEALDAFMLFSKLFEITIEMIGEIKQKYKINNLNYNS